MQEQKTFLEKERETHGAITRGEAAQRQVYECYRQRQPGWLLWNGTPLVRVV
jgi:hypothetical protein